MTPAPRPRVLVILNPAAGQDDPAECIKTIETFLEASGASFEIRRTEGEGDALEWARAATEVDRIIVGGGDGTIMEAITGMIGNPEPVPIAQLPLGTANLLARALAIPIELAEALKTSMNTGVVASMDVGYLPDHDRYFALIAGSGWDARMIDDASREMKNRLGFFAYIVTGLKNLFTSRASRVTLRIDGKTRRFHAHSVMVINVGEIHGSEIALGDKVSPHDGKLDIAVVSPRSTWGLLRMVTRVLTSHFEDTPELHYFTGTEVEVTARPPLKLQIDGDALGETPYRAKVLPSGVRLVVSPAYAESNNLNCEATEPSRGQ